MNNIIAKSLERSFAECKITASLNIIGGEQLFDCREFSSEPSMAYVYTIRGQIPDKRAPDGRSSMFIGELLFSANMLGQNTKCKLSTSHKVFSVETENDLDRAMMCCVDTMVRPFCELLAVFEKAQNINFG